MARCVKARRGCPHPTLECRGCCASSATELSFLGGRWEMAQVVTFLTSTWSSELLELTLLQPWLL